MNLLHLSDTHLGYCAYRKVTEEGVNQREQDVYYAFRFCIDYALATKPDIVIHAGDLFDAVRPTNRAIAVAFHELRRLSDAGIPCVVISGNHETPRLKETGNIFSIFRNLPKLYPVYGNTYETVHIRLRGKTVAVHAIPQCLTKEDFEADMKAVAPTPDADYNVLCAHGAVTGIAEFRMNECNEQFLPASVLAAPFDYIALGHYHASTRLQDNAFYAGSTERFSFTEASQEKGMLSVRLGKHASASFIPIPTRPMVDIPAIPCEGRTLEDIHAQVIQALTAAQPDNKVVRLSLQGLPAALHRSLDVPMIRELCKKATHLELKTTRASEVTNPVLSTPSSSLAVEFERFMADQPLPQREAVLALGLSYLRRAAEEQEAQ